VRAPLFYLRLPTHVRSTDEWERPKGAREAFPESPGGPVKACTPMRRNLERRFRSQLVCWYALRKRARVAVCSMARSAFSGPARAVSRVPPQAPGSVVRSPARCPRAGPGAAACSRRAERFLHAQLDKRLNAGHSCSTASLLVTQLLAAAGV